VSDQDRGPGFWVGLGVGWAMIATGVALLVTTGGVGHVVDVGIWIVGLDLVHDLAFAPVATVVALGVVALLPRRLRAPVLAGLGASAVVLLLAWPLLGGYGRRRDNPTILPRDYTTSVLVVLGVIWTIAAAWSVVRAVRARRADA
jgi:hypothetical protein